MTLQEQMETVQLGSEAQAFLSQPFFRKWLDFISQYSDAALSKVKRCPIEANPRTKELFLLKWQTMEEIMELIQLYPSRCIENAREAAKAQIETDKGELNGV